MKNVKTFGQLFEDKISYSNKLTPEQNAFVNKLVRGVWDYNETTGKIHANGYISHSDNSSASGMAFRDPIDDFMGVKFSSCNGYCSLDGNNLTSLEGTPDKVHGAFSCRNNKLKTLVGGPKFVKFGYTCNGNELINLGGIADEIGGYVDATGNPIVSLKGLILRDVVWQVKDFIRVDGLLIPDGRFTRSWVRKKFIDGNEREKSLLSTILDNDIDRDFLDDYFRENPLDMYVLDDQEEIKKGVLRRTGIKDWSKLGKLSKSGLI
jgi:hypothetical protein